MSACAAVDTALLADALVQLWVITAGGFFLACVDWGWWAYRLRVCRRRRRLQAIRRAKLVTA